MDGGLLMADKYKVKLEPLTFEEAMQFFKDKVALTPEQFAKLRRDVRIQAFTISGVASLDILKGVLDEITRALVEGTTIKEFQEGINTLMEKHGWEGLTPYRADNIFRTNIQTAYQVGRYKQMTDPEVIADRPYWQYDAVNDKRTRPAHRALDGVTRRYDDPFWNTWYPPNGYRCRCTVETLSQRQVDKQGVKVETGKPPAIRQIPDGPAVPVNPDPGFDRNPAKQAWEPDLTKYPPALRDAYLARQAERGG
jgi:SPP1 gp7 family putative phage head morphogenesis protein